MTYLYCFPIVFCAMFVFHNVMFCILHHADTSILPVTVMVNLRDVLSFHFVGCF